jgi:hypothetical protein
VRSGSEDNGTKTEMVRAACHAGLDWIRARIWAEAAAMASGERAANVWRAWERREDLVEESMRACRNESGLRQPGGELEFTACGKTERNFPRSR